MATPTPLKTIATAGFVAGTLDILAAITILGKMNTPGVLRYIASGFFGKGAFIGGAEMVYFGLLFHYLIAFSFAGFYFVFFPMVPFFRRYKILSGLLYGIFIWSVMNLVVLPLTPISRGAFQWESALLNMAILIICIGLPVSWIVHRHYSITR